ncbi:kinase-like protein [Mycena amicta]|nr:kinase-like protein [Mycena amicta]
MLKYRAKQVIGFGGYSQVLRAFDAGSGKAVALKKSRVPLRIKRTLLRHEVRVLKLLQGHPAIPCLYGYGQLVHFEYLSMELLGKNIKELSAHPAQSSVKTVLRVVEQMLSALTHVHRLGIVHCDIKPENILVSLMDPSKICLVDFGISRLFRTGVPSQYNPLGDKPRYVVGTLHWASLNAHDGIDLAPRDDLESLAYVALFLLRGDLPWRLEPSHHRSLQSDMVRMQASKAAFTGVALATNFPREFGELLDYARALGFGQIPDYDDLQARFRRLGQRLGCKLDSSEPLDWTPSDVIQTVMFPAVAQEIPDTAGAEEPEDAEVPDDWIYPDDSYCGADIGDFELQDDRDLDLTFPEEQAQALDSCSLPEIIEVCRM